MIRRNPYLLQRFRGCGFLRCDKLYLHLGGDPARLKRQAYCAWNTLARDTDGHTWHPVSHVHRGLLGSVSGVDIKAIPAVKLAKRGGLIDATPDAVPVIGEVPRLPGFFLATGFSGHGFGIGPGAGRLIADLVSGRTPMIDPKPFRLERFSRLERTTRAG